MWIYILIVIIILILSYVLIVYNSLTKKENVVKEAFATMDVYLKNRWDLIPSLVEVVKGYTKHEKQTLEEVINLRNSNYDNMTDEEKLIANKNLAKRINNLMILAEAYPELKADNNFLKLSDKLMDVEKDIVNSRKYYNGAVRLFNDKVQMFPSNIIAKLFGFKVKNMFEVSDEERKNIEIDLGE